MKGEKKKRGERERERGREGEGEGRGGRKRNFPLGQRLDEGDIRNFIFVDMKKGENGSRENIAMLPWKFNVEFDDNNVLSCKLYSQLSFRCVRLGKFIHSFVQNALIPLLPPGIQFFFIIRS